MFRNLTRYIKSTEAKLIYSENKINIINYKRINIFDSDKIEIRCYKKLITIYGNNLIISKLFDEELLIEGNIETLKFGDMDD